MRSAEDTVNREAERLNEIYLTADSREAKGTSLARNARESAFRAAEGAAT